MELKEDSANTMAISTLELSGVAEVPQSAGRVTKAEDPCNNYNGVITQHSTISPQQYCEVHPLGQDLTVFLFRSKLFSTKIPLLLASSHLINHLLIALWSSLSGPWFTRYH